MTLMNYLKIKHTMKMILLLFLKIAFLFGYFDLVGWLNYPRWHAITDLVIVTPILISLFPHKKRDSKHRD